MSVLMSAKDCDGGACLAHCRIRDLRSIQKGRIKFSFQALYNIRLLQCSPEQIGKRIGGRTAPSSSESAYRQHNS